MLVIDGKYNNNDQQHSDNQGGATTVIVGSTIQNSRWLKDLNVDKKSAQIWRMDLGR
jgi:putative N-acetylmannosamine-6-phosphate epimerase